MKIKKNSKLINIWHKVLKHHILFFWDPVFLYMAIIFYLSSIPEPPIPGFIIKIFSTKTGLVLHFFEYFILSFLTSIALRHSKHSFFNKHHYLLAILIASLYGISDEIHQIFVPGRFATISDALINIVGAGFAQFIRWLLKKEKTIIDKII